MSARQPTVGELVQVIAPHPEAGARGIVEQVFRANAQMRTRARVRFRPPYGEGSEVIAMDMLVAIR